MHAYEPYPLQNGYLERLNVYLNGIIAVNMHLSCTCLANYRHSFGCKSSFFESVLIYGVVGSHMQASWVMKLIRTTLGEI